MENNSGFVAGTLVHTDKGLVPIQNLKVGDMVLSKSEDGKSETEYKPVTKTFVNQNKKIWMLEVNDRENDSYLDSELIFGSHDHTVWVSGDSQGYNDIRVDWTRIDEVEPTSLVELCDGLEGVANWATPVLKPNLPNVVYTLDPFVGYPEFLIDFSKDKETIYYLYDLFEPLVTAQKYPCKNHGVLYGSVDVATVDGFLEYHENGGDSYKYLACVYNIEVSDYYSYFVGRKGVWVQAY